MRTYARTDLNHNEITDALRGIGCSVFSLHQVGKGCPDLLVGFRGVTTLIEVKSERGKLTPDESAFFDEWRGAAAVCYTVEEAIAHMVELTV